MASSRQTLERIGGRVPVPQPAFDRLMRRRARKQRNQRIATAVFALILAAAAIGGAIRVLGSAERQLPAHPGPDSSFGSGGRVTTSISDTKDEIHDIALQPDGKIVVAGGTGDDTEFALARYDPDGSLDRTFGEGGIVTTDFTPNKDVAYGVAIQADGKIVVAGASGTFSSFALARYDPDGTLDPTFGNGGEMTTDVTGGSDFARSVAIQSDGKIVAAGPSDSGGASDFALIRYDPDGTPDPTFGADGIVTTGFKNRDDPWDMTIQPDGKIVAAGYGAGSFAIARYRPNGSLDATFGGRGQVTGVGGASFGIAVQLDGKIVAMGTEFVKGSNSRFAIARFDPDGTPDPSFGQSGLIDSKTIPWEAGGRVVVQPNGKIVTVGGGSSLMVVRFLPDGAPDTTFGRNGASTVGFGHSFTSSLATALAVGPDGEIYAAGAATRSKTDSDFAVVRYATAPRTASAATSAGATSIVIPSILAALVGIVLLIRGHQRV